ncbi:uncharacterized protein HD556DRAFT_1345985 [Suillus plorans]|uniref:Uncharacterized protein n=1 Tax=Suillus plorans TaxID=116603 RepID=A0A9P7DPN7_9AGAM|nr:uncharacterized protein HD556DRAFT_1345985 [Suillus plorans]KAG1799921.1 hypothetical protein HD556DRAFT_1345985 [Suillus plorans]
MENGEPIGYHIFILTVWLLPGIRCSSMPIIQSNGAGFFGTRGSTMSTLASRRVQLWHDGATSLI